MKLLTIALFSILVSRAAVAGPFDWGDLKVTAVPKSAVLIPYGHGTTIGGGHFRLTAPYFTLSSLNVTWTGPGTLNIIAVKLISTDVWYGPHPSVYCGLAGDDLSVMFPGLVTDQGNVALQSGQSVNSTAFGCSNVGIPRATPAKFSIPVTVKVAGVVLDQRGNRAREVSATTKIVLE